MLFSEKDMEEKRKHLDFEIVSNERRLMKLVGNPSFKHSHIFCRNRTTKLLLKLDKSRVV